MLSHAILIQIIKQMNCGRTKPILASCEIDSSSEIEMIVKLSKGGEQGSIHLTREIIAARLATDLNLPVPEPYIVEIPPEIISTVIDRDHTIADKLRDSSPLAFGSTFQKGGFSTWTDGHHIQDNMIPVAAGILLFDAAIQNFDRRSEKPNCLVKGEQLRIIDHELAFPSVPLIPKPPPIWKLGGMENFKTPGKHIFVNKLKGVKIDFNQIKSSWTGLSITGIMKYSGSIPQEWAISSDEVNGILQYIIEAKDNIDGCIAETRRILYDQKRTI